MTTTKTETKHTPGPWCTGTIAYGSRCDVYQLHTFTQITHCQEPADALLCAAAPELLEALRYLLNTDNVATIHAKWGEGCNREEVDAMLKQARAAIAKATGKE